MLCALLVSRCPPAPGAGSVPLGVDAPTPCWGIRAAGPACAPEQRRFLQCRCGTRVAALGQVPQLPPIPHAVFTRILSALSGRGRQLREAGARPAAGKPGLHCPPPGTPSALLLWVSLRGGLPRLRGRACGARGCAASRARAPGCLRTPCAQGGLTVTAGGRDASLAVRLLRLPGAPFPPRRGSPPPGILFTSWQNQTLVVVLVFSH